jgi:hypothetical protein
MSSEFPPVIIDSSGFDDINFNESQQFGMMMIRSDEFGSADSDAPVTIEPSLVSLYLIFDNRLIHKGDYTSEQVELIYGANPERTMAVGHGASLSLGGSSDLEPVPDARNRRAFRGKSRQVHTIRVPDSPRPLELGRDFHNFILIVRRTATE